MRRNMNTEELASAKFLRRHRFALTHELVCLIPELRGDRKVLRFVVLMTMIVARWSLYVLFTRPGLDRRFLRMYLTRSRLQLRAEPMPYMYKLAFMLTRAPNTLFRVTSAVTENLAESPAAGFWSQHRVQLRKYLKVAVLRLLADLEQTGIAEEHVSRYLQVMKSPPDR